MSEPLTKDKEHYVWMGGDCQGLNRVRKAVYVKDDVVFAVRLLRERIDAAEKKRDKYGNQLSAREVGYNFALEDVKTLINSVFGGVEKK